jgi:hypothetical protein
MPMIGFNMPQGKLVQPMTEPQQPKLLDRMRELMRRRHYSLATEESYVNWSKRFILFHGKRHPNEMGEVEIQVSAQP